MKQLIVTPTPKLPAKPKPEPSAAPAVLKDTFDTNRAIQEAKERILAENLVTLEAKRLRFLIFLLEKLHSANAEFKALISLSEYHLKKGEIDKSAMFLERIVYSNDVSEAQKRSHNEIVEAARSVQ